MLLKPFAERGPRVTDAILIIEKSTVQIRELEAKVERQLEGHRRAFETRAKELEEAKDLLNEKSEQTL